MGSKGVDDAPASYVTDFILSILHLCLCLGFLALCAKGDFPVPPFSTLTIGAGYFLLAAAGALTVGVVRVRYNHWEDHAGPPAGWEAGWRAHLVCMGLAGAGLALCAFTVARATLGVKGAGARSASMAVCLLVVAAAGAGNTAYQLGVGDDEWVARGVFLAGLGALGLASAHRAARGQLYAGLVAAGGCALSAVPPLFQGALEGRCGADAGAGRCPLSGAFNHNAIANCIAAVGAGFTALGIALLGVWEPLRAVRSLGTGVQVGVGPEWVRAAGRGAGRGGGREGEAWEGLPGYDHDPPFQGYG